METGSDEGDDEQSPVLDAPKMDVDEGADGDDGAELLEDRPGDGGEGSAVAQAPGPRQRVARKALTTKGG